MDVGGALAVEGPVEREQPAVAAGFLRDAHGITFPGGSGVHPLVF